MRPPAPSNKFPRKAARHTRPADSSSAAPAWNHWERDTKPRDRPAAAGTTDVKRGSPDGASRREDDVGLEAEGMEHQRAEQLDRRRPSRGIVRNATHRAAFTLLEIL